MIAIDAAVSTERGHLLPDELSRLPGVQVMGWDFQQGAWAVDQLVAVERMPRRACVTLSLSEGDVTLHAGALVYVERVGFTRADMVEPGAPVFFDESYHAHLDRANYAELAAPDPERRDHSLGRTHVTGRRKAETQTVFAVHLVREFGVIFANGLMVHAGVSGG